MPTEAPTCISIVLCECVIEDKRSNNKTLVNIFNAIGAQAVPVRHPRMTIAVSVTNIYGKAPVSIVLRDPEMRQLLEFAGEVETPDPTAVVDLVFEIRDFEFTAFGTYSVDVMYGSESLACRRFQMVVPQEG